MKRPIVNINGIDYYAGDSFFGRPVEYWIQREEEALRALERSNKVFRLAMSGLFIVLSLLATFVVLMLTGCASLPVAKDKDWPVVQSLPWRPGDKAAYYDDKDYKFLLWEGAPASLFTKTPRGWRLDRLDFVQASTAINRKENSK